jgi:hydrogenase maturation protease
MEDQLLPTQIKQDLTTLVQSNLKILLLGIGHSRMSDDGWGEYIAVNLLAQSYPPDVKIINGKTDYVNRKYDIIAYSPDILIIFDTIKLEGKYEPGTIMLIDEDQFVNWLPLSSHVLPIPVFLSSLRREIENLKAVLVGIIPSSTKYFDPETGNFDKYTLDDYEQNPDLPFYDFNLTPKIQKTADVLIKFLLEILNNRF